MAAGTAGGNPFNGIERNQGFALRPALLVLRIRSMELKGRLTIAGALALMWLRIRSMELKVRFRGLLLTLRHPLKNPFNGIERYVSLRTTSIKTKYESVQWN